MIQHTMHYFNEGSLQEIPFDLGFALADIRQQARNLKKNEYSHEIQMVSLGITIKNIVFKFFE